MQVSRLTARLLTLRSARVVLNDSYQPGKFEDKTYTEAVMPGITKVNSGRQLVQLLLATWMQVAEFYPGDEPIPTEELGELFAPKEDSAVNGDAANVASAIHTSRVAQLVLAAANTENLASTLSNDNVATWVRAVVPNQKIAPARYEIRDGKLAVIRERNITDEQDRESVAHARTDLMEQGAAICEELTQSNTDPNVRKAFEYLQQQLVSDENIIRIAMASHRCEMTVAGVEEELAPSMFMRLKAHTRMVDMYAGQFSEWKRFVESAAVAQMDAKDVGATAEAADEILKDLEDKKQFVEDEVPQIIEFLRELVRDPAKATKRVAYALLRSLENLASMVWKWMVDLLAEIAKQTKDRLATTASKVLVTAVLGIGVTALTNLAPMASKISGIRWVKDMQTVFERQLNELREGK